MTRVVLASASPRRKALLSALGIPLHVRVSDAPEIFDGEPSRIVVVNACAKRDSVVPQVNEPSLVIAADTLVFLNGHVMGKPDTLHEAREMIRRLSGQTHQVLTGVAVADTDTGHSTAGYETTDVTFRALTDQEVDAFVHAVRPLDRAGAYTVDGPGSLLVESYRGCYQNVLGLPMVRLDCLLRELGYSLFELMDGANAAFL